METVSFQILKTMGRWFVILMLLSQPAFSQSNLTMGENTSIWHDALFIFCICFFVAGLIFMLVVRARDEHKHHDRHARRLSHRRH